MVKKWLCLSFVIVFLGACSTHRGLELEKSYYTAEYFDNISLERSPIKVGTDVSEMKVANDYFVQWMGDVYMVPKGFETNFVTVPSRVRVALAILEAPDFPWTDDTTVVNSIGRWTEPSVVHDAAYGNELELVFLKEKGDGPPGIGRKVTLREFGKCYVESGGTKLKDLFDRKKCGKDITYDDIFEKEAQGEFSESARKFYLEKLNGRVESEDSNDKRESLNRFFSLATIYSLSGKNRLILKNEKLDEACYCNRRSCLENRERADAMFASLMYRSYVKNWVIKLANWVLDWFGEEHWTKTIGKNDHI